MSEQANCNKGTSKGEGFVSASFEGVVIIDKNNK